MGNCGIRKGLDYLQDPFYPKQHQIKILKTDKIQLTLTDPINQQSQSFSSPNLSLEITTCILPGLDPRNSIFKQCQDTCGFSLIQDWLFAFLFDGHGIQGLSVAQHCLRFVSSFAYTHIAQFKLNPKSQLKEMVRACQQSLKSSRLDCDLSGTTAVILIVTPETIHSANVGDSRAILASLPRETFSLVSSTTNNHYARPIEVKRKLETIPLTVEQKPNQFPQHQRILNSGGVVKQLSDSKGKPIGPYRVWLKDWEIPGLAMSRALGDFVAVRAGVVSTPVLHSVKLYKGVDQFLVLASDGIWDVMEGQQVVSFVEKFRKQFKNLTGNYPACQENSSIARILCEEARYRWLGVVEKEDVLIDDISCVVIQIFGMEPREIPDIPSRKAPSLEEYELMSRPVGKDATRKDPIRGSVTNQSEILELLEDM